MQITEATELVPCFNPRSGDAIHKCHCFIPYEINFIYFFKAHSDLSQNQYQQDEGSTLKGYFQYCILSKAWCEQKDPKLAKLILKISIHLLSFHNDLHHQCVLIHSHTGGRDLVTFIHLRHSFRINCRPWTKDWTKQRVLEQNKP